tara:strand:+ start:66 stop:416 length:351 start_codon:yes stop_codon:yes gene_type:complete
LNKILHLNLYRKYFDEIANGTKTIEYRDKTDYWKKRIENREYDVIKFRNGYAKNAPTMLVEYKGWGIDVFTGDYELYLGKVLEVNYQDDYIFNTEFGNGKTVEEMKEIDRKNRYGK